LHGRNRIGILYFDLLRRTSSAATALERNDMLAGIALLREQVVGVIFVGALVASVENHVSLSRARTLKEFIHGRPPLLGWGTGSTLSCPTVYSLLFEDYFFYNSNLLHCIF
jgi:hypothetical protein